MKMDVPQLSKADWIVRPVEIGIARRFVIKHHYAPIKGKKTMIIPDEIKADPIPLETGQDFKNARQALGLTQSGLASALELAGADSATCRSWENERRNASGPVKVAIRLMLTLQRIRTGRTIP